MADAGKIVITPKGAYSSTKTYEWLDEVSYNGNAYVALKTVTGVTPSDDGVNWRLFLEPNDIVAGNLVPTFTEASTRSNIISEENLSTILGKVKKYFTDLKGHAFNDTVKNLTTEETGSALDASQGKVLKEELDGVNSNLTDLKMLGWTVPEECPIQNEVSGNQFIQKVGRVDLGDVEYVFARTANGKEYYKFIAPNCKYNYSNDEKPNYYLDGYTCLSYSADWFDKIISRENLNAVILDFNYHTVPDIKNGLKGKYLYYELAAPITMTIDGNEAVTKVNESLEEQGLLEQFNGEWFQGWIGSDGTISISTSLDGSLSKTLMPCKKGDVISIICDDTVQEINVGEFVSESDTTAQTVANQTNTKKMIYNIANDSTTLFRFSIRGFTPTSIGKVRVYINNDIEELKNDLDKLNSLPKGSIIQIEADKDDTETTTQKYGWQYLGTSNIQYENGSANLLVTNVYRKNN